MTSSFVVLSDMHLGYDRSTLNTLGAQEHLASEIAKIAGGPSGAVDRLILNGDCIEGCVPKDADLFRSSMYVSPFTGMVSRAFFAELVEHVQVKELVIIPGNHDYALWRAVRDAIGALTATGGRAFTLRQAGQDLPAATGALDAVIGPSKTRFQKISLAYPAYFLGSQWPYCAFHHGHFLDDLMLGQESAEKYHALAALGTKDRPAVVLDDQETLWSLSKKTDDFLRAMWAPNSPIRALAWAMWRKDENRFHCTGDASGEKLSGNTSKNLQWFLNLLIADAYAPFPGKQNKAWPSYLFVGHDHSGGSDKLLGPDGFPFKVINTGGWVIDAGSYAPHGHVVSWEKGASEPVVHVVKV